MTAQEALERSRSFAVVGASPDAARYSHEVLVALRTAGYEVLPINPKYDRIDDDACYPSLAALPIVPDMAVVVLAPANARGVLADVVAAGIPGVWLPPGTAAPDVVAMARDLGLAVVADECPVGTLKGFARP